jgi:hypothetical protein
MTHYEIKITGPEGGRPIVLQLDKPDDISALNSALEICRRQTIEVWEGPRQIGSVMLSGAPRLTL